MPTTKKREKKKKIEKVKKGCQEDIRPGIVPQVGENKAFGEGTKRAFTR